MDSEQAVEFTRLWTRVQPNVFSYIASTVRNLSDAEDVLQCVAAAAVRKFEDYEPERPFIAWVIGIARFEILNYLRSHTSDRHDLMDEEFLAKVAGAYEAIHDELDDRRHALKSCILLLKGRAREVVTHRYFRMLKTGAIAELLGLSPGHVSVILNRSYKQLRHCIEKRIAAEAKPWTT